MINPQYVAGFVDGEGSIGLNGITRDRNNRRYTRIQAYIQVSQRDIRPLEALKHDYGGNISIRKPTKQNKQTGLQYVWYIASHERIIRFLSDIVPFMIVKKAQAELLLKFCESRERLLGLKKSPKWARYSEYELELMKQIRALNGGS